MRFLALIAFVFGVWMTVVVRAEDAAPVQTPEAGARAVKSLPAPSNAKINSVVTNKPAPGVAATAGQALTADGTGKTLWANIKGTAINSSPASSGMVLTADGNGGSAFGSAASFTGSLMGDVTGTQSATVVSAVGGVTAANIASGANAANAATTASIPNTIVMRDANGNIASAANVIGVVPIANGGTGSATQNFVDISSDQNNVAGSKTFLGTLAASTAFIVEPRPNNTGTNNFFAGAGAGAANTTGTENIFIGKSAGAANVTSTGNTFVGVLAGRSNTAGYNTFIGNNTGRNNTGGQNTFLGAFAGVLNTFGQINTFVGYQAGGFNKTGSSNVCIGQNTGLFNDADYNTFVGQNAGFNNTSGSTNTFIGQNAGTSNSTASGNTFVGQSAGATNSASSNTFVGQNAGAANTLGSSNVFVGFEAAKINTTGDSCTVVGSSAGTSMNGAQSNVFLGTSAGSHCTTGGLNTFIGVSSGGNIVLGSRNIQIGTFGGPADEDDTIRIGNVQTAAYIAGIYNVTSFNGVPVYIASDGHLGTLTSSRRFKDNIADMNAASESVLKLRPVTFNYKTAIDPKGVPQFGLIAEDVDKIDPKLVVRDDKREIYTVRYEAVNAMLLNEFLKAHKKIEEQEKELAAQDTRMNVLEARLNELTKLNGGRTK